jgi:hypothetical protein
LGVLLVFFADFSHPAGPVGVPAAPLFLEATQQKTVRTVTVVRRIELGGVESQVVGIGVHNRRRPTVPAVADAPQSTVTSIAESVAEARGRGRVTPAMNHQQRNSSSGGASRHPVLAYRARKPNKTASHGPSGCKNRLRPHAKTSFCRSPAQKTNPPKFPEPPSKTTAPKA